MLGLLPLLTMLMTLHMHQSLGESKEPFEVDPKLAEEWLARAKKNFNPKSWANSADIDSLDSFQQLLDTHDEIYALFYNASDNSTFSTSPFFKTTSMALHDDDPGFPIITVDLANAVDIAKYYGLSSAHTIVLYFYQKAPIVFKYHEIERSPRPLRKWMDEVKQKVKGVVKMESEKDLMAFENSDNLMFLMVEEGREDMGRMFAAVSANYPDLQFSWMVKDEYTQGLQEDVCEEYKLACQASGSNIFFYCYVFCLEIHYV